MSHFDSNHMPPCAGELRDPPVRILVIDDNAGVLAHYRKILASDRDEVDEALDALEGALFGTDATAPPGQPRFVVDLAQSGELGCGLAWKAREEGRPYAVAFVDMRMPGGWDGLETIEVLWRTDPQVQVVICTAYSDHAWDEITARLGGADRLFVLCKPFETIEVLRLASALADKWSLHRALAEEQFELHYEPRVDLRRGHVIGMEALVRWRHPELGLLAPDRCISLAEETGMIVGLGEWVLRTACRQAKAWHAAGHTELCIAVNVSAMQFHQSNLPQTVSSVLAETGLAAHRLELELTESVIMEQGEAVARALAEIKALGVTLSLDDFGTGYSSLGYLRRFPFDIVKIDRSFVTDITHDVDDASLTRAIIAMARSLRLRTVAEGVETEGQLSFLRTSRCDAIQGRFFSAPLPADDASALLRAGKRVSRDGPDRIVGERTVLLVDDEKSILSAVARVLRRDGYRLLSTVSPREAFELLAVHPVGVVVCDGRMPELSGVEFLGRVKDLYPETVRIMLSGYTEVKAVTDAINRGAVYKFLTKPWNDDALRDCVAEAYQRYELMTEDAPRGAA